MQLKLIICCLAALLWGCSSKSDQETLTQYESGDVSKIRKYEITGSSKLIGHSGGYVPAIGSSLYFAGKEGKDLMFYGLTDRGPNAPFYQNNLTKVIFFHPKFEPAIVKIKVSKEKAEVVDFFKILKTEKICMTGMPTNGVEGPSFYEVPVDTGIRDIHQYESGMDAESLTMDREGNFWIGEEYDPAIIKVNGKTLKVERIFKPGEGLPEFTKYRQINRGFEAMAVAPNGKVYALLEGVMKFDNDKKIHNKIIRMLEIDPVSNKTRVFAYQFNDEDYQHFRKVKVGDLSAINNEEFLLVEQGKVSNGTTMNVIYKINIKDATDIQHYEGRQFIEHMSPEAMSNISVISKKKILNMNEYGWNEEKLEGLTIVDSNTIAVSNDNDFGIDGVDVAQQSQNEYKIIQPEQMQHTKLWIIKFRDKIF